MQSNKIFQGIAIPYSALISVIFGILVFSFPIGAYLFFSSELGDEIDHRYPISEFEFAKDLDFQWASSIEIGHIFAASWVFFLVIFVIATFGPNRSFLRVLSPLMAGTAETQEGNYMVQAIKWFTVIVILSAAIDSVQRTFGISITPPQFGNDLTQLFFVTLAPIIEETGFRVVLVGIPVFLLYVVKPGIKSFFSSLWNPSASLSIVDNRKAVAIIVASAVLFGAAHVISEQGWSFGKMAQATMSGLIIGWVYVRYGFVAAVLIHWATNYVVFSYGYLVASVNDIRIMDAFSHSLLQTIEILFVIAGGLSIAMLFLARKKRLYV